ncbi:hypothetical protein ABG768_021741, partial [Culter alburnus]
LAIPNASPWRSGLTLMTNKGPRVPQIIKLLDWQDNPDHYIIVLERPIPCTNMLSFMKLQGGSLNERTARHVMQQVIHTANVCCECGVFHRDIKLENVLINHDTLEAKLIDFGCGELMKESPYMAFRGTRVHCPPEYHVNGGYHAKPATVWSLGILLFATVCGYYPSDNDLSMISEDEWCKPGLSQECCLTISASLQPDPEQRLGLEEMWLHDWFKILKDSFLSNVFSYHPRPSQVCSKCHECIYLNNADVYVFVSGHGVRWRTTENSSITATLLFQSSVSFASGG